MTNDEIVKDVRKKLFAREDVYFVHKTRGDVRDLAAVAHTYEGDHEVYRVNTKAGFEETSKFAKDLDEALVFLRSFLDDYEE